MDDRSARRKKPKMSMNKMEVDNSLQSRGQVDLLDMGCCKDSRCKYVAIYRDYKTNFILLRPLKKMKIKLIANILMDIFAIFGAPSILQTNENHLVLSSVLKMINNYWPHVKIVDGGHIGYIAPTVPIDANYFSAIRKLVLHWYLEDTNMSLFDAIRYAQLMINRIQPEHLSVTPYEAMFHKRMQLGLELCDIMPDRIPAKYVDKYLKLEKFLYDQYAIQ